MEDRGQKTEDGLRRKTSNAEHRTSNAESQSQLMSGRNISAAVEKERSSDVKFEQVRLFLNGRRN